MSKKDTRSINNKTMSREERRKSNKRKKKRGFFRVMFSSMKILTLFVITGAAVGLFLVALVINHELEDIPVVDAQFLETYPTSEITDKDGKVIWKPTDYRIETMTYEEIPDLYKDFLVATEDKEFWESKGFSPKGIFNMVTGTVRSKVDSSYKARGGSTIDQQLIKNKYFDGGRGHSVVTRKIQEIFLSMQLNQNFTKEEIMTFYVNDLEFAERATGVKAIMKTYFNKTPSKYEERTPENIAEIAYLVGLSQSPTTYNLYTDPESGTKRMKTVLDIALEDELITEKEHKEAREYDLKTNLQERGWQDKKQHKANLRYKTYTDGVKKELKEIGYDIDKVSVKVVTHLDRDLYEQIEDKVRQSHYYLDQNQQIAVSVVNSDGIVVGMVGSRTGGDDELNRAMQTTRSTGSSTKPLLAYAPLLQYFGNQYNTASKFDTSNYRYPGSSATMHNYGKGVYGYQTMHESLIRSFNTPVGRIMDGILGTGRVSEFLSGLDLDNQETFTSVDGLGIHASTLEVASAYNAFNNLGQFTKPRFVDEIIFSNGKSKEIKPRTNKAMNPSVAWTINHMLRGVPNQGGTAPEAHIKGYGGYAAKTGTVGFAKTVNPPAPYGIGSSDLWYNSYTNEGYSISVWAGYDKPNTSPQLPSYYRKHQTLGKDLQIMLNNSAPKVWKMPEGVSKISGEGRKAYYRVTDTTDSHVRDLEWSDLKEYDNLEFDDIKGDDKVDPDWEEKEKSKWFEYYKDGGELRPTIIDKELYDKMKGSD